MCLLITQLTPVGNFGDDEMEYVASFQRRTTAELRPRRQFIIVYLVLAPLICCKNNAAAQMTPRVLKAGYELSEFSESIQN